MYKLMVVDDSNIIRSQIQNNLNDMQFELVAMASTGDEAVRLFKQFHPEVVTMDITMPGMDGLECIQNLIEIDPEVRILVVSALSDKATGIKALEYGAQGFVCKPFTNEQLMEALIELIQD